jgi:hypothetical protein
MQETGFRPVPAPAQQDDVRGSLRGSRLRHHRQVVSCLSQQKLTFNSAADPDPGSGMGKKSGSGMNNLDHISESLETIFWVKLRKFFDADLDPEWKNSGPGWKKFGFRIIIPDPQHWI